VIQLRVTLTGWLHARDGRTGAQENQERDQTRSRKTATQNGHRTADSFHLRDAF
jgi:hypothetical protein